MTRQGKRVAAAASGSAVATGIVGIMSKPMGWPAFWTVATLVTGALVTLIVALFRPIELIGSRVSRGPDGAVVNASEWRLRVHAGAYRDGDGRAADSPRDDGR